MLHAILRTILTQHTACYMLYYARYLHNTLHVTCYITSRYLHNTLHVTCYITHDTYTTHCMLHAILRMTLTQHTACYMLYYARYLHNTLHVTCYITSRYLHNTLHVTRYITHDTYAI